jgi:tetratricopeptide (TPR) repeat protein
MKRKDELRDIYQNSDRDFEKDFTPQVAEKTLSNKRRDLTQARIFSLIGGGIIVLLCVALISVVVRDFLKGRTAIPSSQPPDQTYIPKYTLPTEAAWVMDYEAALSRASLEDESIQPGEKPLSIQWVKKAAYHIIMGQQAMVLKEIEEARRHFSQVVAIYPDIEGIHRALGMLYIEDESYELAANHLELALEEEESFDVVNNLGTAYIGLKNYEQAEKHLTRALDLKPESPTCHKNLGVLYKEMENENKAIYHFEKYLDLRPNDLEAMQTYALYLTKTGRWKQAATFLEDLTQSVTDVAPIYFLLAQVQVQNGQQEDAVKALQRGIQLIDPTLALAWMSRKEFNEVRGSQEFRELIDQLEIASVSLDDN